MEWFVQLHKKICEWEWYTDVPTCKLFFHILLKCNYKEAKWRGIEVKPGDFITSFDHLAKETWLSIRQVRTALEHLETTWEVTKQSTSQYTILTLTNWGTYNIRDDKPSTNGWQTDDKPSTTTNKYNKKKKEKKEYNLLVTPPNEYELSIQYLRENREKVYTQELQIPEYVEDEWEWHRFVWYWSELSKLGKLKAEWEKTFEIKRRFATWMSRKKETYQKTEKPSVMDIVL